MNVRGWGQLLTGTALAGLLVGLLTPAEPPCAHVLSQLDSGTVATPAIAVFVPPEEAAVQPVRVHLDESATAPGHVITLAGRTLVLPQPGAIPETVERDRTGQSLRVSLHGSDKTARYLSPPRVSAEK